MTPDSPFPRLKLDLSEENPRYVGPPPQCVTCSRFVAVNGKGTRRIVEAGDYGSIYNVEFQCRRCVEVHR